jgi:hypothetical protein
MIARNIFFIFIIVACLSCKPTVDTPEALMKYVVTPEHGLVKENRVENIGIKVMYRPHDIILEQSLDEKQRSRKLVDSARNALHDYTYFVLKLDNDKKEVINRYAHSAQFQDAINYVSFEIGKDIRLIQENDTIPVFDFVSARAFGMAESTDVLVGFQTNILEKSGMCVFQFNDSFFGTGLNHFEFKISDIKSIPTLSLNL